jgi:N6-adenosine-specific RNA methylase IME4
MPDRRAATKGAKMSERLAHKQKVERLAELESVIERHVRGFLEVGRALLEVRNDKLYLLSHSTFEAWVQMRFAISRRRAYELIAATEVDANLRGRGLKAVPSSEREARELAKFPADVQPVVWEKARELAGDDPPTGKEVRRAAREMNRQRRVERLAEISAGGEPIETVKPHPILLADPPWRYDSGTTDPSREIENQYPTMSTAEIAALPVANLATPDAVLFMWIPPALIIPEAAIVLDGWGFTYKTHGVWDKVNIGGGYWMRIRHEDLIIAVRGDPPHPNPSDLFASIFMEPKSRTHSRKPRCAYEMIERYFPTLPKLELFARQKRDGWSSWGQEVSG